MGIVNREDLSIQASLSSFVGKLLGKTNSTSRKMKDLWFSDTTAAFLFGQKSQKKTDPSLARWEDAYALDYQNISR
jgi:hypothetical protein